MFLLSLVVGVLAAAPRVVVIGVDGADPRVFEALWARGEAPATHALAQRGFYGRLASAYAGKSPIIWTTVATGQAPERHGIQNFLATGRQDIGDANEPVSSADRRVKALWEIAGERGRKVLVAGWWATWPVTPVNGLMVSDRPAPIRKDHFVWPLELAADWTSWTASAERAYGKAFPGTEFVAPADRLVSYAAVRQFEAAAPDAAWIYLRRPDVVGHHHWHGFEELAGNDAADDARSAALLLGAYRAVDASIGDIVAAAPADTRVLVVSDHGFHLVPDETRVRLDFGRVLTRLGLLVREGNAVVAGKSKVLPLTADYTAAVKGLRVNLAGRDPHGVVPDAEREAVLADVTRRVEAITYAETGEPAFKVRRPPAGAAADLEVEVRRGPFSRTGLVIDGRVVPDIIEKVWRNTGGHNKEPPGIVIAAGPGIGHEAPVSPSVTDVGATTLHWLGLPVGADMVGRAWTEPLGAAGPAVAKVPTWEAGKREVAPGPKKEDDGVKDLLKELGYIE